MRDSSFQRFKGRVSKHFSLSVRYFQHFVPIKAIQTIFSGCFVPKLVD